jgi:anti-anti-sigma factor
VTTDSYFEIEESQQDAQITLSLRGELDMGSTRILEDRITRLRAKKHPVVLDLAELQFIDSTGLHLLVRAIGDARTDGWELRIGPELSPTVRRLFMLVHFNPFG